MKTLKKTICFILALMMLLSAVSCSESKENGASESSAAINDSTVGDINAEAAPEEQKMKPDLDPSLNFDGAEIRIMNNPHGTGDWTNWGNRDIYAESLTGEPINDAVFERNALVEDTLGVKIVAIDVEDQPAAIQKQASAGTGDYHIATARIQTLPATVMGGYLRNLFDIPHMDLEKPWYDARCVEDASLYDLLFYITGSMIILDDDSTGAIVFNKQIIENHNLESPYNFVLEGTWTLDKFAEYADIVDNDEDGNGVVDLRSDCFGFLWQRDAIMSFIHAGGSRLVSKDADGEPYFAFDTENTVNLFEKLSGFIFNENVVQNMHNYSDVYPDIYAEECNIFKDNRALFMWLRMKVVNDLRDMEADFGIIPVPKLSETQGEYCCTVTKYTAGTVCIPNDASIDIDAVGAVIELMSAEGHYGLREAYYERNLGTKIARDPESTEMLDLIMSNRVYDTGEIYDIGGFPNKLHDISSGSRVNITTLIKQQQKSFNKLLEKNLLEPMRELAEQLSED